MVASQCLHRRPRRRHRRALPPLYEPKQEDLDAAAIIAHDAGTIELSRRPADPRTSLSTQSPSAMHAHIFEVPAGHDISACLVRFSCMKNLGLCVLAGTGDVDNIDWPFFSPVIGPIAETKLTDR